MRQRFNEVPVSFLRAHDQHDFIIDIDFHAAGLANLICLVLSSKLELRFRISRRRANTSRVVHAAQYLVY
jgi:sporulation-control protein spo0M